MAIARKPNNHNPSPNPAIDIEALIAKGGSVSAPTQQKETPVKTQIQPPNSEKETCAFTFRIPTSLLSQVDEHRRNQPYKVTRQQWLLAAVVQQLQRESHSAEGTSS